MGDGKEFDKDMKYLYYVKSKINSSIDHLMCRIILFYIKSQRPV